MKTNIRYMGFGFPIILTGVEAKEENGHSFLDIPHQKLSQSLFLALLLKQAPLLGAEFKFLRKYLDMSQEEFAHFVGAKSHSNIAGWEKKKDHATGMTEQTELIIRLKLAVEFSQGLIKFDEIYSKIIKSGLVNNDALIEIKVTDAA